MKNGDTTLPQVEKQQIDLKKDLNEITSGNPKHRSTNHLYKIEVSNNSENLLNEIRQIVYSLYQSKQITKKAYNNIIKSINI